MSPALREKTPAGKLFQQRSLHASKCRPNPVIEKITGYLYSGFENSHF